MNFTGVVRLGIHCTSKEKVAVKIIDRTKLSPQIRSKVRNFMDPIIHEFFQALYFSHLFTPNICTTAEFIILLAFEIRVLYKINFRFCYI